MTLNGQWKARIADDHLRRSGVGLEVDDSGWPNIDVPGHWRSDSEFADTNGPVLYRHHFNASEPLSGERRWIKFDGIYYQGDAWLDGAYIGDPEGYFVEHSFDITDLCKLATDHVLAVEVSSPRASDKKSKRNVTGIFDQNDFLDPLWNMGGLWRGVELFSTGPVRIGNLRVLCRDASESRAHVRLHAELDSLASRSALVRTFVDGVLVRADEHTLAAGANSLDWAIDIDNPRLWWPWQLGEAALTDIAVEVQVDGVASDSILRRTGLRQVAHDNWIFTINGERLYTRGIAVGPTALRMADCSPETIANDVTLARELGMNLLRPLAHVARPEFYDAADAAGMLVWQDMPLYGAYARSVRRQAVRQARAMVDQLSHHPSIVLWCAHNQPTQPDPLHQQLPTWTRSVLDAWVRKALSDADDSRPVTAHSGVLPHFPKLDGTDMNASFGWRHGSYRDINALAERLPKLTKFVSGFGAQSAPTDAPFVDIKSWPQLDWDTVSERFGMQRDAFERFVPASEHPNYASWAAATQEYQAELLKHHIEALRKIKYSPNGGFCFLMLADAQPCIGYGIYDHNRVPKRAVEVVRAACAEVIVTADAPSEHVLGTEFVTDIHVVSDLPNAIAEATVTATLTWSSGSRSWAWQGAIDADVCAKVGSIALVISAAGDARLDLHLTGAGVDVRNSYEFVVR